VSLADLDGARLALAINLELSHGRHGASARVELLERAGRHVARIGLSGWVEEVAIGRFETAVSDLAARDVDGLILDCSRLRHVNAGSASRLTRAVAPFAARREGLVLQGLSKRLRERLEKSHAAPALESAALAPAVVGREWTS
jgi:hypothetical protein